jgi:leucyl-tRNA synthetase
MTAKYDHKSVEAKWKDKWLKDKIYQPDLKTSKKPFYNLMMYPYPSAEGLHVGNMYAFTGADVYGRFKRMQGLDVFEPIGLDGFGIHSENYAIKVGKHPSEHAKDSEKNFYRQLGMIGNSFAWDNRLETYDPEYYKWTQWLFIQMFKKGLAYKASAMVNWCPSCKTVLADEQVIDGKCERCKTEVVRREMSSWFFKITEYAERLLTNIDGSESSVGFGPVDKKYNVKKEGLRWPEKIKLAQRNWIGKKYGLNITYPIKDSGSTITVFTTRPDTNFGATFIVVAPEYAKEKLLTIVPEDKVTDIERYVKTSLNKSEQERIGEGRKKTGVFTGLYAVNQLNGHEMPIWISDFVLVGVGTGAVVGVPGHDMRDFEFAKEFDLSIVRVVVGPDGDKTEITRADQVQEEDGEMINSEFLNGVAIQDAVQKMADYIVEKGWGEKVVSYHLRDWLISRQRYWGPPIPMIYCSKCAEESKGERNDLPGWYSVDIKNLPVVLPEISDFIPKGDGTSPLANAPSGWKDTKCPGCGGNAQRELDVSDTFLDSSWYFLAYPNLDTAEYKENTKPINEAITKGWLPVDAYIGGAEHAVLHLLYSRFVTMVLRDLEYLDFEEPFPFLYGHGLLIKDGAKMSKSRGNIVVPDEYIEKYGADTLRTYLMFLGPFDQGGDFRDTGIEGMSRFINRLWNVFKTEVNDGPADASKKVTNKMHQTIKKVSNDLENFRYNTAISAIMEYVNELKEQIGKEKKISKDYLIVLAQLVAPFAPHLAEEVWGQLGQKYSVHNSQFPSYDEKLVREDSLTIAVQVNGKLRSTINIKADEVDQRPQIVERLEKDKKLSPWISGKRYDVIYVPGKIVNFVLK